MNTSKSLDLDDIFLSFWDYYSIHRGDTFAWEHGVERAKKAIVEAVEGLIGEDEPAAESIYKARNYSGTPERHDEMVQNNERAKARNKLRAELRQAIKEWQ